MTASNWASSESQIVWPTGWNSASAAPCTISPSRVNSAVAPCPTADGVLGMARTMPAPGKSRARSSVRTPAITEITRVSGPSRPASGSTACAQACGFTASTTISGLPSAGGRAEASTPGGRLRAAGSITATGPSPSASQRRSSAPPMLPQPINQIGAPICALAVMSAPKTGLMLRRLSRSARRPMLRPGSGPPATPAGTPDNNARTLPRRHQ